MHFWCWISATYGSNVEGLLDMWPDFCAALGASTGKLGVFALSTGAGEQGKKNQNFHGFNFHCTDRVNKTADWASLWGIYSIFAVRKWHLRIRNSLEAIRIRESSKIGDSALDQPESRKLQTISWMNFATSKGGCAALSDLNSPTSQRTVETVTTPANRGD